MMVATQHNKKQDMKLVKKQYSSSEDITSIKLIW